MTDRDSKETNVWVTALKLLLGAAVIIGGVGWIVATVLRNLVTNLSRTAGVDKVGNRAGLADTGMVSL